MREVQRKGGAREQSDVTAKLLRARHVIVWEWSTIIYQNFVAAGLQHELFDSGGSVECQASFKGIIITRCLGVKTRSGLDCQVQKELFGQSKLGERVRGRAIRDPRVISPSLSLYPPPSPKTFNQINQITGQVRK